MQANLMSNLVLEVLMSANNQEEVKNPYINLPAKTKNDGETTESQESSEENA